MSDRRVEALAALDQWEQTASVRRLSDITGVDRLVVRSLAALRSTLERHHRDPNHLGAPQCACCVKSSSPCPDETAVIDAVLGPEEKS